MNDQQLTLQSTQDILAFVTANPKAMGYIAAPYTARHHDNSYNTELMEERIRLMSLCMGKLMGLGVLTTSPLLMHLVRMHTQDLPGDWSTWQRYSEITMDKTDFLIVLEMEGTYQSVGVKAEREYMFCAGKPIFFLNVKEFLMRLVSGIEVGPVIIAGNDVTKQSEGPDERTTDWAIYMLELGSGAIWAEDFPDEDQALASAKEWAAKLGVEVVEPAYKTNPDSEYNRRRKALAALPSEDCVVTPELKETYGKVAYQLKAEAQAQARPKDGDPVIAIRDGNSFKKGATGILLRQGGIDSENYYFIQLDGGGQIGPSLEDYWDKLIKG